MMVTFRACCSQRAASGFFAAWNAIAAETAAKTRSNFFPPSLRIGALVDFSLWGAKLVDIVRSGPIHAPPHFHSCRTRHYLGSPGRAGCADPLHHRGVRDRRV